jgi:hypothetical protein
MAISASSGHHGYSSPRGDGSDNLVINAIDQRRGRADDNEASGGQLVITSGTAMTDELLPHGLDSHRYRCCGNGVVAPVAEWIGQRLAAALS